MNQQPDKECGKKSLFMLLAQSLFVKHHQVFTHHHYLRKSPFVLLFIINYIIRTIFCKDFQLKIPVKFSLGKYIGFYKIMSFMFTFLKLTLSVI